MHSTRTEIPSYRETYFIVILALGFLIQLMSLGFGCLAYTALLPSMKTDLGLSNTLMGFFQVGILTGYLLFAYLCSIFAKRWGLSIVVTAFCALAGLAMMALGFVSSYTPTVKKQCLINLKKIAFYASRDAVNAATDPTTPSEGEILQLLEEIYE